MTTNSPTRRGKTRNEASSQPSLRNALPAASTVKIGAVNNRPKPYRRIAVALKAQSFAMAHRACCSVQLPTTLRKPIATESTKAIRNPAALMTTPPVATATIT